MGLHHRAVGWPGPRFATVPRRRGRVRPGSGRAGAAAERAQYLQLLANATGGAAQMFGRDIGGRVRASSSWAAQWSAPGSGLSNAIPVGRTPGPRGKSSWAAPGRSRSNLTRAALVSPSGAMARLFMSSAAAMALPSSSSSVWRLTLTYSLHDMIDSARKNIIMPLRSVAFSVGARRRLRSSWLAWARGSPVGSAGVRVTPDAACVLGRRAEPEPDGATSRGIKGARAKAESPGRNWDVTCSGLSNRVLFRAACTMDSACAAVPLSCPRWPLCHQVNQRVWYRACMPGKACRAHCVAQRLSSIQCPVSM